MRSLKSKFSERSVQAGFNFDGQAVTACVEFLGFCKLHDTEIQALAEVMVLPSAFREKLGASWISMTSGTGTSVDWFEAGRV